MKSQLPPFGGVKRIPTKIHSTAYLMNASPHLLVGVKSPPACNLLPMPGTGKVNSIWHWKQDTWSKDASIWIGQPSLNGVPSQAQHIFVPVPTSGVCGNGITVHSCNKMPSSGLCFSYYRFFSATCLESQQGLQHIILIQTTRHGF